MLLALAGCSGPESANISAGSEMNSSVSAASENNSAEGEGNSANGLDPRLSFASELGGMAMYQAKIDGGTAPNAPLEAVWQLALSLGGYLPTAPKAEREASTVQIAVSAWVGEHDAIRPDYMMVIEFRRADLEAAAKGSAADKFSVLNKATHAKALSEFGVTAVKGFCHYSVDAHWNHRFCHSVKMPGDDADD